jgi:hypothetical protein
MSIWETLLKLFADSVMEPLTGADLEILRRRRRQRLAAKLHYGMPVAIRTSDGHYVASNPEEDTLLSARVRHIAGWETFTLIDPENPLQQYEGAKIRYGNRISLKAHNDQFVMAEGNEDDHPLLAAVPHVREWEIFEIVGPPDRVSRRSHLEYGQPFALKASHGLYVSHHRDDEGYIRAMAPDIGDWEAFAFMPPDIDDEV